jgi:hypothetical protein
MVSATSITTTDTTVIDRAAAFLRKSRLSAHDQLTIEHAISLLSRDLSCSRAAQLLNQKALSH